MPANQNCPSCEVNTRPDLPPRERIYVNARWRLVHAFDASLAGWLVLLPLRHVTALDELTTEEAADLGPLLRSATSALRDVTHCSKTYVALFAEAEGFQHLHFHIIPRMPDLDAEFRGPRVFGLLGGPDKYVPHEVMDQTALRLMSALPVDPALPTVDRTFVRLAVKADLAFEK
jgi:diadenosine tetraphosphate (Ap4A) HIT family hydrolase